MNRREIQVAVGIIGGIIALIYALTTHFRDQTWDPLMSSFSLAKFCIFLLILAITGILVFVFRPK